MNLTFLGLCLACFGVSLAEGFDDGLTCSNLHLANQVSVGTWSLILGVAFVEIFLRNLGYGLYYQARRYFRRRCQTAWKKVSIQHYSWTCIFNLFCYDPDFCFHAFWLHLLGQSKISIRPKANKCAGICIWFCRRLHKEILVNVREGLLLVLVCSFLFLFGCPITLDWWQN